MTSSYTSILGYVLKVVSTVVGSSLAIGLFAIYYYQKDLIYLAKYPPDSKQKVPKPSQFNVEYWEDVELVSRDNVKLHAYWMPLKSGKFSAHKPKDFDDALVKTKYPSFDPQLQVHEGYAEKTLLYFHANAGNCGHRLPIAVEIQRRVKCNVLLLSYRGYGHSEGSPSEAGIRKDSEAALDWVYHHPILTQMGRIDKPKVIAFGQSIGGAVAIDIVSRFPEYFSGLIVENTFLSLPKLIPYVMPYLAPFSGLCTEIWPSIDRVKAIDKHTPILFLSSCKDEMIPQAHMLKLCETVRRMRQGKSADFWNESSDDSSVEGSPYPKSESDTFWQEFPNAGHNDACIQPGYFQEFETFFHRV